MFYVNILLSEFSGKYYIGSISNLEDQLIRHNSGRNKATKLEISRKLAYAKELETRSEAYWRKMKLKSQKSHKRTAQLICASRFYKHLTCEDIFHLHLESALKANR